MHLFKMTYKYISNITHRKYGKPPGAREKKRNKNWSSKRVPDDAAALGISLERGC